MPAPAAFSVQPLVFPGGDTGAPGVHVTVNGLALAGATPLYLRLNSSILAAHGLSLCRAYGFAVQLPQRGPCNDGGLSYGQIIEAAQR